MNILDRVCINLKMHAYNLETDVVLCNGATIFANFLSKQSMKLKIHAYNLETVIERCNGATIFVIALTF